MSSLMDLLGKKVKTLHPKTITDTNLPLGSVIFDPEDPLRNIYCDHLQAYPPQPIPNDPIQDFTQHGELASSASLVGRLCEILRVLFVTQMSSNTHAEISTMQSEYFDPRSYLQDETLKRNIAAHLRDLKVKYGFLICHRITASERMHEDVWQNCNQCLAEVSVPATAGGVPLPIDLGTGIERDRNLSNRTKFTSPGKTVVAIVAVTLVLRDNGAVDIKKHEAKAQIEGVNLFHKGRANFCSSHGGRWDVSRALTSEIEEHYA